MNLAEALAHVDAMTPAEKAAWDQANGFTPEADRRDPRPYLRPIRGSRKP